MPLLRGHDGDGEAVVLNRAGEVLGLALLTDQLLHRFFDLRTKERRAQE